MNAIPEESGIGRFQVGWTISLHSQDFSRGIVFERFLEVGSKTQRGGAEPRGAVFFGKTINLLGIGKTGRQRFVDEYRLFALERLASLPQMRPAIHAFQENGINHAAEFGYLANQFDLVF